MGRPARVHENFWPPVGSVDSAEVWRDGLGLDARDHSRI
jgi:hypothetical protein